MLCNRHMVLGRRGRHPAASLALALMTAAIGALMLTFSAFAAGPPIDGHTHASDSRCLRVDPENLFFINLRTPSSGNPGPGDTIGAWFSDETGLNQGSTNPSSPFYLFFHLTGPSVDQKLTADTTERFDQRSLFNQAHKECRIQVNVKTAIPARINGGPYPPGDYTVTMTAWDNDQTRLGGDHSNQTWHFTIAAPQPLPSPTSQVSPASQPSPASQVLAASAPGPSLPKAGSGAGGSSPDQLIGASLLLAGSGGFGIAIARIARRGRRRRLQP